MFPDKRFTAPQSGVAASICAPQPPLTRRWRPPLEKRTAIMPTLTHRPKVSSPRPGPTAQCRTIRSRSAKRSAVALRDCGPSGRTCSPHAVNPASIGRDGVQRAIGCRTTALAGCGCLREQPGRDRGAGCAVAAGPAVRVGGDRSGPVRLLRVDSMVLRAGWNSPGPHHISADLRRGAGSAFPRSPGRSGLPHGRPRPTRYRRQPGR